MFWGDTLYRQISVFYSTKQSYICKSPHLALCPNGRLAKLWNPEHGKRPVWVGWRSGNLMATGWRCHSNGIVRRWPCRVQTRLLLFWVWWKTSEVIFCNKIITKLLCTLGPTFKHSMNCFSFFFLNQFTRSVNYLLEDAGFFFTINNILPGRPYLSQSYCKPLDSVVISWHAYLWPPKQSFSYISIIKEIMIRKMKPSLAKHCSVSFTHSILLVVTSPWSF